MALFHRSTKVAPNAKLDAPDPHRPVSTYDPEGIIARLNRTFRRRLSDRVEDLFRAACLSGDLDTAEEVLTVLERMQTRRREKLGQDRRINDEWAVKARNELAQRKGAVS